MDPNFREIQYELLVSKPRSTIEVMPAESLTSSRHHQVTFNFSCKHIYNRWVMGQDSEEYQFLGQLEYRATTESLRYEVPRFNNRQKLLLEAVDVIKGLENLLDVSYLERLRLSQVAVDSAWEILADDSTPRGHRQRHRVRVDLDLMWVHHVAIDEISYAEWMSHQAVEAAMVPATEASIKSLRSQTLGFSSENRGSCVVCMEDLEAGGVVLTMPCSHIFHGECIQTWLRTSHFCPVCRYQMPTD